MLSKKKKKGRLVILPSALSSDNDAFSQKVSWKASIKLQFRSPSSPNMMWYMVASMVRDKGTWDRLQVPEEPDTLSPAVFVGLWIGATVMTREESRALPVGRARPANQSGGDLRRCTCGGGGGPGDGQATPRADRIRDAVTLNSHLPPACHVYL